MLVSQRLARLFAVVAAANLIIFSLVDRNSGIFADEKNGRFVIYYGWYNDGKSDEISNVVDLIIEANPEFVISPYYTSAGHVNITPSVMEKFHENSIKVILYFATDNARADLNKLSDEIEQGFERGADGIMLDEVSLLYSQNEIEYYKHIYLLAKSHGKLVIANPGTARVSNNVMSVSDIVSFEHQWRLASELEWFSLYPKNRFMGISSNDIYNVMGYEVDQFTSIRDTIEAWEMGIGYHYSTDKYTALSNWFSEYDQRIDYPDIKDQVHLFNVVTVDKNGNQIKGMWIEVSKDGKVYASQFSPARFTVLDGQYEISANSFQNFAFSHWSDGSDNATRQLTVSASLDSITAIYDNLHSTLFIESHDIDGRQMNGLAVEIIKDGIIIKKGHTPYKVHVPIGKYEVRIDRPDGYVFTSWNNGVKEEQTSFLVKDNLRIYSIYQLQTDSEVRDTITNQHLAQCFDIHSLRQSIAETWNNKGIFALVHGIAMTHNDIVNDCM